MEQQFEIGQKVIREFGGQEMVVVGFEPELIENVLTKWEDEQGNTITGKFMEAELQPIKN